MENDEPALTQFFEGGRKSIDLRFTEYGFSQRTSWAAEF
jgi:hypothetical protein